MLEKGNKKFVSSGISMSYFKPKANSSILELGPHDNSNLLYYSSRRYNVTQLELNKTLFLSFNKFEKEQKYDYVICNNVFEPFIDPIKVLTIAKDFLKLDGFVYITSPLEFIKNRLHCKDNNISDSFKGLLKKSGLSSVIFFIENDRVFCHAKIWREDKLRKINFYISNLIVLKNNKFRLSHLPNVDNYIRIKNMGCEFNKCDIIGISRIRNESLIIKDTLKHMEKFVDCFIILDDKSEDDTVSICCKNKHVKEILINTKWEKNRIYEETKQRQMLYDIAKLYSPKWIFYFDADERFEGNIKEFLLSEKAINVQSINIKLFDAYITKDDKKPYSKKYELYNFRKYFGPEMREIKMIWRNSEDVYFKNLDSREPYAKGNSITRFYCQHYGKSLSINHWEDTCDYYSMNFPEPYKTKWKNRKGKAIHSISDFNRELYYWDKVKGNAIKI